MEENRKAMRFNVQVPMQICALQSQPPEFHAGQLRDISRTGILFHAQVSFEAGTTLELASCLPAETERSSCVLARATVKTIRAWELPEETTPLFGIAVTIERIEFAQPAVSSAA
jgi:hypothetical protein